MSTVPPGLPAQMQPCPMSVWHSSGCLSRIIPTRTPLSFLLFLAFQEDYLSGIRHYDREEYHLAIEFLERALTEYNVADTACRVLCEGPQRFEDYEYLNYKATFYEAIAGKLNVAGCGSSSQPG